ncbi:MAG: type II toxin-antitoxin system PemK/MazF family toxin [Candidatus Daviesbacteria bacterium]|nr:type II toxin-antitoxin system PemK/MazF family toxin [Candidatus Daviesbacteria bacterium]
MKKSLKDYPKRGQIYIADLEPAYKREIHKKRPVLIVSNNDLNGGTPYVVVIPSSSIVPEVISAEMVYLGKAKGFNNESVLLPFFIRSIDKERLIKKVGVLSKQKMLEVEEALRIVLTLKDRDML